MRFTAIAVMGLCSVLGACGGSSAGDGSASSGGQAQTGEVSAKQPLRVTAISGEKITADYSTQYIDTSSDKPSSNTALRSLTVSVEGGALEAGSTVELRLIRYENAHAGCGMTTTSSAKKVFSLPLAPSDAGYSGDFVAAGQFCDDDSCQSTRPVTWTETVAHSGYCWYYDVTWKAAVRVVSPSGEERWLEDSVSHQDPHDFQLMFEKN